jgi:NIMA (never in mitosis gene a)-related kinase 1/4/5
LDVLHQNNICHRDLKTHNVFITKQSNEKIYKLGDLNVAKIQDRGLMTTVTGTPYYSSPEVLLKKPYDKSSEVWSLGCLIYEMACLKSPFEAMTYDELVDKVTLTKPKRIP